MEKLAIPALYFAIISLVNLKELSLSLAPPRPPPVSLVKPCQSEELPMPSLRIYITHFPFSYSPSAFRCTFSSTIFGANVSHPSLGRWLLIGHVLFSAMFLRTL